jgi:hypothetical protein
LRGTRRRRWEKLDGFMSKQNKKESILMNELLVQVTGARKVQVLFPLTKENRGPTQGSFLCFLVQVTGLEPA